jgi:hypothetical protein
LLIHLYSNLIIYVCMYVLYKRWIRAQKRQRPNALWTDVSVRIVVMGQNDAVLSACSSHLSASGTNSPRAPRALPGRGERTDGPWLRHPFCAVGKHLFPL